MSQIPMTSDERIGALRRFGYTEQEAGFLCLAALHGGFFVRRQYSDFCCRQDGGSVTQLIDKALDHAHIRASTYGNKTQIYHLCARPFYAALGQAENRNRRRREPTTIKNKLMGFDFVLAHRDYSYLATEQEKLAYFAGTLQIPVSCLPAKLYDSRKSTATTTRYFVDKYPIFLSEASAPDSPAVVAFCFVDEGLATLSRFETYLAQYRSLFAALHHFHLVYVAASASLFEGASHRFARFFGQPLSDKNGAIHFDVAQLREHFAARRLYEAKEFAAFDRDKLIRLRNDLNTYSGKEFEGLYERWKLAGDGAVVQKPASKTSESRPISGSFSTYLLQHRYEFLGTLTAF